MFAKIYCILFTISLQSDVSEDTWALVLTNVGSACRTWLGSSRCWIGTCMGRHCPPGFVVSFIESLTCTCRGIFGLTDKAISKLPAKKRACLNETHTKNPALCTLFALAGACHRGCSFVPVATQREQGHAPCRACWSCARKRAYVGPFLCCVVFRLRGNLDSDVCRLNFPLAPR